MTRPNESAEVREEIVRALRLDLVGPWAGHPLADERLPGWARPSNWYLTGFLVPEGRPPTSAPTPCGRRPRGRGERRARVRFHGCCRSAGIHEPSYW